VRVSRRLRVWRVAAVVAVAPLFLGACSTSNLNFRADTRVKFQTPKARQTVALPVTVTWDATGVPAGTHFGVFVDRAPMRPGHGLSAVVGSCPGRLDCQSTATLESRGVFVTNGNSVRFDTLPNTNTGKRHQARETQRVVVVYLDAQNRRVSESAFALEFFLDRQGSAA
jgi:hypothetical protein